MLTRTVNMHPPSSQSSRRCEGCHTLSFTRRVTCGEKRKRTSTGSCPYITLHAEESRAGPSNSSGGSNVSSVNSARRMRSILKVWIRSK